MTKPGLNQEKSLSIPGLSQHFSPISVYLAFNIGSWTILFRYKLYLFNKRQSTEKSQKKKTKRRPERNKISTKMTKCEKKKKNKRCQFFFKKVNKKSFKCNKRCNKDLKKHNSHFHCFLGMAHDPLKTVLWPTFESRPTSWEPLL